MKVYLVKEIHTVHDVVSSEQLIGTYTTFENAFYCLKHLVRNKIADSDFIACIVSSNTGTVSLKGMIIRFTIIEIEV